MTCMSSCTHVPICKHRYTHAHAMCLCVGIHQHMHAYTSIVLCCNCTCVLVSSHIYTHVHMHTLLQSCTNTIHTHMYTNIIIPSIRADKNVLMHSYIRQVTSQPRSPAMLYGQYMEKCKFLGSLVRCLAATRQVVNCLPSKEMRSSMDCCSQSTT